jgi:predicted enzyme related to lactoylglutathione lyase
MCDAEQKEPPSKKKQPERAPLDATSRRPEVHVSIDVPSLDAGLRFYAQLFAWEETARPFPQMAILDANNVTVCMHEKAPGSKSSERGGARSYDRHWTPVHLDLHVTDYETVVSSLRKLGGTVEREFKDQGPRPVAFCSDPFGNGLCILGPRR